MRCSHKSRRHSHRHARSSTGNAAFDAYREETLRRLEDEQEAFKSFLDRLRKAKDEAEFDQFMDERRSGTSTPPPASPGDERGPMGGPTPAPA